MAKTKIALDVSEFEELITKLDKADGNIKETVEGALALAGELITPDVIEGMEKRNLPAGGKYSSGETASTIIRKPKVIWSGTKASIGIGFDKSKHKISSLLITGRRTPRMAKDEYLNMVFTGKMYMKHVKEDMRKKLMEDIQDAIEGKK